MSFNARFILVLLFNFFLFHISFGIWFDHCIVLCLFYSTYFSYVIVLLFFCFDLLCFSLFFSGSIMAGTCTFAIFKICQPMGKSDDAWFYKNRRSRAGSSLCTAYMSVSVYRTTLEMQATRQVKIFENWLLVLGIRIL